MNRRAILSIIAIVAAAYGVSNWLRTLPSALPTQLPPATDELLGLSATERRDLLQRMGAALRELERPLSPPQPGDWLAEHEEPGQSFAQYLAEDPVLAVGERRVIYIQRIGPFAPAAQRIVALSAECLALYYGLEVRFLDDHTDLDRWPSAARREHPSWGMPQLLSPYILDEVLRPQLPADAAVLLGFTAIDLWPGQGWNFVFGQASLRERVGVWSLARNGNPDAGEAEFRVCLLRTLKTATHETGHIFSLRHCTAYECNLCGSNHQQESDRRPLTLCAECLPKLCWATGSSPRARYEKLARFYADAGLSAEARDCRRRLAALAELAPPATPTPSTPTPAARPR